MSTRALGRQFPDIGSPTPVDVAQQGRLQWSREQGMAPPDQGRLSSTVIPTSRVHQVAKAYGALPSFDPAAVPAFRRFADETRSQFEFMTRSRSRGGMGIHAEVTAHDPYKGPAEMFKDVHENNRIKVYGSGTEESGQHPFLTNEENDMFRAIHDVFGHAGAGRGFERHGEEAAYLSHSSMYSPLARQAMTTETRGQNASFVTHGVFPEQKVAILPGWARTTIPILGRRGEQRQAVLQARQFNAEQFGPARRG